MLAAYRGDLHALRPRRVCLIKPSSLGDIAHAFPLLASLRRHWPDAELAWVVNRGLRSLVEGQPHVDAVIPFDRAAVRFRPGAVGPLARFVADLRRRRFDVTIDLQGLLRSGLMTAATGAPVRVGLRSAREGAGAFYNHAVDDRGEAVHAVDRLLRVASAFGAPVDGLDPAVACAPADRLRMLAELGRLPRPWVALNIGARWLTKRWPPGHFAAIARRAREQWGAGIVLVGAPEDRPLVDELLAALGPDAPGVLDLCGRTTLPELAALAREVDLFVSNDTGPLHLAAAAGARTVGIYTCTSPERTGPYGPLAAVARSCVWCAPSFVRTCPRMECMAELTPDRVWAVIERHHAAGRGAQVAPA